MKLYFDKNSLKIIRQYIHQNKTKNIPKHKENYNKRRSRTAIFSVKAAQKW